MAQKQSKNISPTAHYTGYVWTRHGLSHPQLATPQGRFFFNAMRPLNAASAAAGGPTLEGLLLARHQVIDQLLTDAIESGEVTQVIELAAGLSPRGWRFVERYGARITYIETDLPGMVARKRKLLAKMGAMPTRHRIAELDVLSQDKNANLEALAGSLNPRQGLAIISEGLLNYLDPAAVRAVWAHISDCLKNFRTGHYFSDLHLAGENGGMAGYAFTRLLARFVRQPVHLHFATASDANLALMESGFDSAQLHRPGTLLENATPAMSAGAKRVRVIAAKV